MLMLSGMGCQIPWRSRYRRRVKSGLRPTPLPGCPLWLTYWVCMTFRERNLYQNSLRFHLNVAAETRLLSRCIRALRLEGRLG